MTAPIKSPYTTLSFQLCANWTKAQITGELSLPELLQQIRTKSPGIDQVRAAVKKGDRAAKDEAKASLPMFCPGPRFRQSKKTEDAVALQEACPFDIDLGANPDLDPEAAKAKIATRPDVIAAWVSSSGTGVNGLSYHPDIAGQLKHEYGNVEQMKAAYKGAQEAFAADVLRHQGFVLDPRMTTISQGFVISYDPSPYVNPNPQPFQAMDSSTSEEEPEVLDAGAAKLMDAKRAALQAADEANSGRHDAILSLGFTAGQLAAAGRLPAQVAENLEEEVAELESVTSNAEGSFRDAFEAGMNQPLPTLGAPLREVDKSPPPATPAISWKTTTKIRRISARKRPLPWPLEYTAKPIRDLARDISRRTSTPAEFFVGAALCVAGAVNGGKIQVKGGHGFFLGSNLYGAVSAPSGTMKSAPCGKALEPVNRLEKRWHREHLNAMKDYRIAKSIWDINKELRREQLLDAEHTERLQLLKQWREEEPKEPIPQRLLVNDGTVERVAVLMQQNPNGILRQQDELAMHFEQGKKKGREDQRALDLSAFEPNGPHFIERISRDPLVIEHPRETIFGTIQPTILRSYLREKTDGLFERFFYLEPQTQPFIENCDPADFQAEERYVNAVLRLEQQEPRDVDALEHVSREFHFVPLSQDARVLYRRFVVFVERAVRVPQMAEHGQLASWLGKTRSLVLKLALITHLLEGKRGSVDAVTLSRAIMLTLVLLTHAEQVFTEVEELKDGPEVLLADMIRNGDIEDGFTARDLKQLHRKALNNVMVLEGLARLVDLGWLSPVTASTGGRPTTRYRINPAIHDDPFEPFETSIFDLYFRDILQEELLGHIAPHFPLSDYPQAHLLFDLDKLDAFPPKPTELPPEDDTVDVLVPETPTLPGDTQEPPVCPVALEREAVLQMIRSGAGISAEDLHEALLEKFDFTPEELSLHLLALQSDEQVTNHDGLWTAVEAREEVSEEPPVESRNTDE